jgi:hypothetical protein
VQIKKQGEGMGLFNKKVHATRKKVTAWAEELELIKIESDDSFVGMQGSALVKVIIHELQESDTSGLVLLTCHLLGDVPYKPAALEELFFGVGAEKGPALFWDVNKSDDGTLNVFLELAMLDVEGSLDKAEFVEGITMLANAADELDDKLQKKIGGHRAEDVLNSTDS